MAVTLYVQGKQIFIILSLMNHNIHNLIVLPVPEENKQESDPIRVPFSALRWKPEYWTEIEMDEILSNYRNDWNKWKKKGM